MCVCAYVRPCLCVCVRVCFNQVGSEYSMFAFLWMWIDKLLWQLVALTVTKSQKGGAQYQAFWPSLPPPLRTLSRSLSLILFLRFPGRGTVPFVSKSKLLFSQPFFFSCLFPYSLSVSFIRHKEGEGVGEKGEKQGDKASFTWTK